MSRYRLKHSDAPVQNRDLPLIPPGFKSHQVNLEEGVFHRVLVAAEKLAQLPQIVFLAMVALIDFALSGWLGLGSILVLATCHGLDWLILEALPRRRISFGPVQTQWLTLAALRLTAAVVLMPLAPAVGIAAQIAGLLLVVYAFVIEPARLEVSQTILDVPGFANGKTLRLLHVADVHLERNGVREHRLLQIVREILPDAVLFSGDFLNLSNVRDSEAQQAARSLWNEIGTIAPVYAVSGSPPVDPQAIVCKIVSGLPLVWLRDEVRDVAWEHGRVRVVGVTCTHDPIDDGDRLRKVLRSAPDADFTVLLYHAPDLAPQAADLESIDLHLAGHTHGGQIRLPWYGAILTSSMYGKRLEMGLYRIKGMLLFVSRGIGLEGKGAPRARLLCPPQVMLLELRGTG